MGAGGQTMVLVVLAAFRVASSPKVTSAATNGERDVPWYADQRDLPDPDFCDLVFYERVEDLRSLYDDRIRSADIVIVGSFVPEGVATVDAVAALSTGLLCFYDIDTPVTLAKLESGDEEYVARRQVPLFDIYFSFAGGPTLKRLQVEFRAKRAEPLYMAIGEIHT